MSDRRHKKESDEKGNNLKSKQVNRKDGSSKYKSKSTEVTKKGTYKTKFKSKTKKDGTTKSKEVTVGSDGSRTVDKYSKGGRMNKTKHRSK